MAGKWAARAVAENNIELIRQYDLEWRDLFEGTLARAHTKREKMAGGWRDFPDIVKSSWVAFRDYYV